MTLRSEIEVLLQKWETYVKERPDAGENYDGYYAGHDACAFQLRSLLVQNATSPEPDAVRKAAIEECAQYLETSYPDHAWLNAACAAIRSLAALSRPAHGGWHDISTAPVNERGLFGYLTNSNKWYCHIFDTPLAPTDYGYTHYQPLPAGPLSRNDRGGSES
jgi:hypothetical protein